MGIFLPEKILTATLASGLATIKGDLSGYIPDIFDADDLGNDFIQGAIDYLEQTRIMISQGYPMSDQKLPGWFVVPSTSQETEDFIGGYGIDEAVPGGEDGDEINVILNNYSVRIITASLNGDVTLMLNAVCRYILLSAREELSNLNMNALTIQATDYDPVYQFLPQEFQMRSTLVSFQGTDTWLKRFPLIKDAKLYIRYNPNEDFIEVD